MKRWGLLQLLLFLAVVLTACRNQEVTPRVPTVEVIVPAVGEVAGPTSQPETSPPVEAPPAMALPPAGEQPPGASQPETEPVVVKPVPEPTIIQPPVSTVFEIGSTIEHQVGQGEWLMQIARCYGASYRDVLVANPTYFPDYLVPGTTVTVPNIGSSGPVGGPPCIELYTVQAGDTPASLAAQFDLDATTLQSVNPGPLSAGRQIVVPVVSQPAAVRPTLTHDLLFNLDGSLARWNRATGNVEVISFDPDARLLDLATNGRGSTVLLKLTQDNATTVDYVLYLPAEGTLTPILERLQPVDSEGLYDDMVVGTEGNWAAFVNIANNGEAWLQTFATAEPGLVSITPRTDLVQEGVVPHLFAGTEFLLWQDNSGVDKYTDTDYARLAQLPSGTPSGVLFLETLALRPNVNDFLLLGSYVEGQAYYVLAGDGAGGLLQVPNSGRYVNSSAVSWLPDGRLLVVSPPLSDSAVGPDMVLYDVQAGSELALVESTNLTLPDHKTGPANAGYAVMMPEIQPSESKILMAVSTEDGAGQGLYTVDLVSKTVEYVNSWPDSVRSAYWVPDGSGVLAYIAPLEAEPGEVLYITIAGQPAFSLANWLGKELSGFNWVP